MNLNQLTTQEDGVVASYSVSRGQEVKERDIVAVIYPDSNLRIQALAPESTLGYYRVGDTVYITNQNGSATQLPLAGKIEKISQIPEETEYEYDVFYSVFITVNDISTLCYGMNVMVYNQNPYEIYQGAE